MFRRHPPIVGILGNWLPFLSPTGGFCYTMASWIRNSGTETASNVPKVPVSKSNSSMPVAGNASFCASVVPTRDRQLSLDEGRKCLSQNCVGIHAPRLHACLSACGGSAGPALLVAYGSN
ncbi:uncharacterized protein CCOS01_03221 [Colletotrichum costaricense]|uniref:Uncharacterized protein n=1 Tax=Colletotrichum costaricense TaxID=1209916 RepID=A0AAI9Z4Y2_9PEZI|nr:uncharacterized protein CCOS01_03221 [Colletotrichum costaricense]KAK1534469.1 hypothetical protein CCOS01_03221 [Colletotrichum costaricense]KAK1706459.1 hypothetical protein BDP67DRAFT_528939 [Colletotrichum lupini]